MLICYSYCMAGRGLRIIELYHNACSSFLFISCHVVFRIHAVSLLRSVNKVNINHMKLRIFVKTRLFSVRFITSKDTAHTDSGVKG